MDQEQDTKKRIYELHAEICQTLSNPKRLEILDLLREGEMSVGELASRMGIRVANLSQHLAILRKRGVVIARREGVNSYYRVADPKIIQACMLIREVLHDQLAESAELAEATGGKSG